MQIDFHLNELPRSISRGNSFLSYILYSAKSVFNELEHTRLVIGLVFQNINAWYQ